MSQLLKALSCIVEGGQNDSKNQSKNVNVQDQGNGGHGLCSLREIPG